MVCYIIWQDRLSHHFRYFAQGDAIQTWQLLIFSHIILLVFGDILRNFYGEFRGRKGEIFYHYSSWISLMTVHIISCREDKILHANSPLFELFYRVHRYFVHTCFCLNKKYLIFWNQYAVQETNRSNTTYYSTGTGNLRGRVNKITLLKLLF